MPDGAALTGERPREPGDLTGAAQTGAADAQAGDRVVRALYYVTGAAALISIASAAILAVVHHWVPVGDHAIFAVRAGDVFSSHPPLLGTWTSASASAGVNMNNPGPLYYDALAIPTAIFGSINAGVAVGVAFVNFLGALGIGIVAKRQGGYVVGAAAFTIVAVMAWTLGSEVLIEPVQPGALLMPMLLVVMLSWGVARDDLALLPWLVGAASIVLQTYVTYVFLMGLLGAWAVACMLLRLHSKHYAVRRVRKISIIAALVALLCWLQPIYQQFFGDGPGNFSQLWRAVRAPAKTFGPDTGTRLMADVVSLPPFWFRPGYHDFLAVKYVPKSSLWLAVVTLLILAAVLAVIARVALRSTRDVVGTAAATALVGLLAGLITVGRIPVGLFGVSSAHVFRWLWPLAAFCTFVLLIAVIHYARHVVNPIAVMAGLTIVAVLFGALNLPTTDQNPDTTTDAIPAARDIGKQLSVLKGKGPLVFDVRLLPFAEVYSSYLMAALQHYGIDFKVNEAITEYQVGHFRRFDGSNARGALVLREGDVVDLAPPNGERVAVHYGLDPDARAEMDALRDEIAAMMNDGSIALNDAGDKAVANHVVPAPPTDPSARPGYVQSGALSTLARDNGLTATDEALRKIDHYAQLRRSWLRQTVAVYLVPIADLNPPG